MAAVMPWAMSLRAVHQHAEVKPFGVAESDGSVAGHARDEVDHAEKRRRDPPSVSASSTEECGEAVAGEPALAPVVDGGGGAHGEGDEKHGGPPSTSRARACSVVLLVAEPLRTGGAS